ncbi:hypothetical protein RND71_014095 [Anisodus tanguticus]|uniref:Uncharacterized protein n=1 Tax=Anisodus tanguticus TaxID=243964 RepID=A0AAE1SAK6_9SOLA|nr:hypothetical protein RND71_014095 [Anisodus tanguticus]
MIILVREEEEEDEEHEFVFNATWAFESIPHLQHQVKDYSKEVSCPMILRWLATKNNTKLSVDLFNPHKDEYVWCSVPPVEKELIDLNFAHLPWMGSANCAQGYDYIQISLDRPMPRSHVTKNLNSRDGDKVPEHSWMANEGNLKFNWRSAAWIRTMVGAIYSLLGYDLVGDISCSVLKLGHSGTSRDLLVVALRDRDYYLQE